MLKPLRRGFFLPAVYPVSKVDFWVTNSNMDYERMVTPATALKGWEAPASPGLLVLCPSSLPNAKGQGQGPEQEQEHSANQT